MRVAVIPAYNEERTVGDVVRRVREFIPHVVVVDDGSSDATAERARAAGAYVVCHVVNRGLGGALGTGIRIACDLGADFIVTLDADGQHDPVDAPALIAPIERGDADVVIGVRERSVDIPVSRRVAHAVSNIYTRLLFGVYCSDTQSGFRAMSRSAAMRIEIRTNRMEVSSEIIGEIGRHKLRLVEVPIRTIYTDYSLSKGQSFTAGLKTAWSLLLRKLL
ncbi:MAG: glycosyltransferase family 2 protein [Candidatus Uhrbacteria bacterium]